MKNLNTAQGMTALSTHAEQARTLDYATLMKRVCAYAMLAMLSAYAIQLINSAGDIGAQEKNVISVAFALTLLVVIPIIALNICFISRQRASEPSATDSPLGTHSIKKQLVAWVIPTLTVAVLPFLGWGMTHSLDLYKPIASKVAPARAAIMAGG